MELNVLAIGDVAGVGGLDFLRQHLGALKKLKQIDFCVVNGENASVTGILPEQVDQILMAGADVITLGNHTYGKQQIGDTLEENPYLLRPDNFSHRRPGKGMGIYDCKGLRVKVINLEGRIDMKDLVDDPFARMDQLIEKEPADITLVDFHAEATSEKQAMGFYVDGRVSALWGTHTHVPTADEQVLPKGTGYQSDLGMTGAIHSIIGIPVEQSLEYFLGGQPGRFVPAQGPCQMQGSIFCIDTETKQCVSVERIQIR